jgi:F-type H+-transporting ATPase subunit b
MPQINQLSEIFVSQLFWLAVVFGIIYFVIGRGMVPKIRGAVTDRESRIASDLEQAQAAREEADRTEAEWRERIDASRTEAMKLARAAKEAGAKEVEERTRAINDDIAKKIETAEAKIRKSAEEAAREIDGIAVEVTRELYSKLTGKTVPAAEATRAVKAVLNG